MRDTKADISGAEGKGENVFLKPLTPRLRRTCALAWLDLMSAAQIAAVQGIRRRAVEQRLERARRHLRAAGVEPPDGRRRGRRTRAFQLAPLENI